MNDFSHFCILLPQQQKENLDGLEKMDHRACKVQLALLGRKVTEDPPEEMGHQGCRALRA